MTSDGATVPFPLHHFLQATGSSLAVEGVMRLEVPNTVRQDDEGKSLALALTGCWPQFLFQQGTRQAPAPPTAKKLVTTCPPRACAAPTTAQCKVGSFKRFWT